MKLVTSGLQAIPEEVAVSDMRYRQVHLDFHTSEQIVAIGKDFDADEFADTLLEAGVDSITCFSRCHHGMIYHDTRFEARHPHLQVNLLGEQIRACHERGIRVPVYVTVAWDVFTGRRHPEWQEIGPDGKPNGAGPLQAGWPKMCLNTPHVDYIIAQTEEVLDMFDVDGFFFDIVFQNECCCPRCLDGMAREGLDIESPQDRRAFAGRVTNAFKDRLTAAVRAKNTECSIFYNAGHVGPYIRPSLDQYSHLELESLPSGGWGYEHFPITARYARNLGKQFIGMTGKFLKSWADFGGFKTPAALEYECFSALAMGGGCSVGDQLHPSGKITKTTYDLIGGVYRQVAEKEPWCRGASPVTEVGVITPELVVGTWANEASSGVHRVLKERYYQYDFVDFEMDLSKYRIIVLPDVIRLSADRAKVLNDHVGRGGKLLISYHSGMGESGYDFLIEDMPARVKGDAPYSPDFLVAEEAVGQGIPASEHVMYERGLEIEPSPGAKSLAQVWKPYFERSPKHFCSHAHTPVEGPAGYPGIVANDRIVYVAYPIFAMYKRHGSRVHRDVVINALKLLLPDEERLTASDAPTTADIMLNYQRAEDRYILHVLHYVPERRYASTDTIEDVIPLYNVAVDLLIPPGYEKAAIVPDGAELSCTRSGSRLLLTIPEVRGHCMVEIRS